MGEDAKAVTAAGNFATAAGNLAMKTVDTTSAAITRGAQKVRPIQNSEIGEGWGRNKYLVQCKSDVLYPISAPVEMETEIANLDRDHMLERIRSNMITEGRENVYGAQSGMVGG